MKYIFKYRIRHIIPTSSRVVKHFKNANEVDEFLYCLSQKYFGAFTTEYDIENYGSTKYALEKWDTTYGQWNNVCYIESLDGKTWRSYKI